MWVNLNGDHYNIIGDPHLGKEFRNGVPLDRRGEREVAQYQQFWNELHETKLGHVATIIMGDLLDRFTVNDNTKMRVYNALSSAAGKAPEILVMMGNHDVSRDTEEESSFNIIKTMLSSFENIVFVTEPIYWMPKTDGRSTIMIVPYNEFEATSDLKLRPDKVDAVFGHWDTVSVGNDHNLIPIIKLCQITDKVYNGHVHTPSETYYTKDGSFMHLCDVIAGVPRTKLYNVGSMQPYSHGEDPTEKIYVTRTLEEFQNDPSLYHDKVLRLKLKRGQDIPQIDALQWSIQYEDEEKVETEVKMEEFSFEAVFKQSLIDAKVSASVVDQWWDKFAKGNGNDLNS